MNFINDSFMLNSDTARRLYSTASSMPLIDYHCHLDPRLIAEDHRFGSLTELMLGGDHYKWRAMRAFGIGEKYITGDASDADKFRGFAAMLPYAVGNPLYHWTHLELKRYFGIDECLCEDNADRIRERCDEMLAGDGFSARGLMLRSGVKLICTTDDPLDSLEHHRRLREEGFGVKVLPTFRPDKSVNIDKDTFLPYIARLGVSDLTGLCRVLSARLDFFAENGCVVADHGLDHIPFAEGDAAAVLSRRLAGEPLTERDSDIFKTYMLRFFAGEYAARGWVMQLHTGALRNNNTAMFRALGADTGYDSINDRPLAEPLSRLLDSIGQLPKTILYSLNPTDNYVLATMAGNFQSAPVRGKIQLGSAWWFNDQRDGMREQLRTLANTGLLGTFVGMLTDSRSFISYPRHEYFRRLLCDLLGEWVERGEYPDDMTMLTRIVRGICFDNAAEYFGFEL